MTRHDQLVASFEQVISLLEKGDPISAEPIMTALLARLLETPTPTDDPRVQPLFEKLGRTALPMRDKLASTLQTVGRSNRAARAYGSEP